jgi:hypothetical protein
VSVNHCQSHQTQLDGSTMVQLHPWQAGPGPLRGDLFGPGSDVSTDQGPCPRTATARAARMPVPVGSAESLRPSRSEDLRAPSSASMSRRCHGAMVP